MWELKKVHEHFFNVLIFEIKFQIAVFNVKLLWMLNCCSYPFRRLRLSYFISTSIPFNLTADIFRTSKMSLLFFYIVHFNVHLKSSKEDNLNNYKTWNFFQKVEISLMRSIAFLLSQLSRLDCSINACSSII